MVKLTNDANVHLRYGIKWVLELTKWGLEQRNTFTLVSNTFYTVFKLESRLNPSLQVFQNLLLLKNVTKQTWFALYPSFGSLYILGITGAAKMMNGKIEKWLSGKAEMKNFSITSRLVLNCSIQNKGIWDCVSDSS